ncbi:hypothetical protein MKK75_35390 [Methylobacterium sp. J-030]|uniref:hypothetical protein n=1 Tax=Methylobacterium sp. J-030 TaxID=2836627 RepID=UPI001FB9D706|nr:hypothetical protein [Methylobacterium sp. J-030]MCJ2074016.1 hypothetical protein [Methylobacterium sp. J-030]
MSPNVSACRRLDQVRRHGCIRFRDPGTDALKLGVPVRQRPSVVDFQNLTTLADVDAKVSQLAADEHVASLGEQASG